MVFYHSNEKVTKTSNINSTSTSPTKCLVATPESRYYSTHAQYFHQSILPAPNPWVERFCRWQPKESKELSSCSQKHITPPLLPGTSFPTGFAASCSPHCRLGTACSQRPPGSAEPGICGGPHPWHRSGWNPGRWSLEGAEWGTHQSPSVHPKPWCQRAHGWSRSLGQCPLAWRTHAGQSSGFQPPVAPGRSGSELQTIFSLASLPRRSGRGVWQLGFGQAPRGTFHLPSNWMNHGSLNKAIKGENQSWDYLADKMTTDKKPERKYIINKHLQKLSGLLGMK